MPGLVIAVLPTLLGAAMPVAAIQGSTARDRSWQGIAAVAIAVRVTNLGDDVIEPTEVAARLCERMRAIASAGSPYPIACIAPAAAPGTAATVATIVVDVAIQPPGQPLGQPASQPLGSGVRLICFTARRTMQAGLEPAPILYGTPPRCAPLAPGDGALLDGALNEALQEILPWKTPGRTAE